MDYLMHLKNARERYNKEFLYLKEKYLSKGLSNEEETRVNFLIQSIYYMDCCLAEYKSIIKE